VDGLACHLHVDHHAVAEEEAHVGTTVEGVGPEHPAELGEERVEGARRAVRRVVRPERRHELVPAARSVSVEDEVAEEPPSLRPWQLALEALAAPFDDHRAAELHPRRRLGLQGHANIVAVAFDVDEGGAPWPGSSGVSAGTWPGGPLTTR